MASNDQAETRMAIIRIGIADDHTLFRSGLVKLIKSFGHMRVVLEASDGSGLLAQLGKMRQEQLPDIILMDLEMPGMDGNEATAEIRRDYPSVKVITLTQYSEPGVITSSLKHGARAYLLKTAEPEEVEDTIWMVYEKGTHYSKMVSEAMHRKIMEEEARKPDQGGLPFFTERERNVLKLLCRGKSCKEIGRKLNSSVSTVEKQRRRVLKKTGCANAVELLAWALRNGMVE